jgi:hypothetical protein
MMTFEDKVARIRSHRNNIDRYHRLLDTYLSDIEREYVEGRLSTEAAALEALAGEVLHPHRYAAIGAAASAPA